MNKVITDAMYKARHDHINLPACDPLVLEAMFKAALSSIIHRFDPQDETTWPESEFAPSGMRWVFIGHHSDGELWAAAGRWLENQWYYNLCYASTKGDYFDPADILPR